MSKKLYIESLFLIFLGMATSLSLPPLNYLFVNFITFSLFFIFLVKKHYVEKNKKLFFWYGWLFGFGYFLTNLYWISISVTFDENFKFLFPFILILIPSFLAIFYGLSSYLFKIFKPKKIVSSFLLFSLIFAILEFIRGFVLTGFPWNLIAYSFSENLKVLSIISIIGTYGFNLFCISLFTSPALLIIRDSKKDLIFCIFFLLSPIFFYINGNSIEKNFFESKKSNYEYKIRSVASNISLDRFYKNIDTESVIKDLIEISEPNLNEKIIFLWPEGIIPNMTQDQIFKYKWLFKEKFNENHLLGFGITNHFWEDGKQKFYNSFSIYDNELNLLHSYDKVNLVPFGEFLPFEKTLKKIGLKSLTNNYQSFSRGDTRQNINIKQNNFSLKILPLICYEIIYSGKIFNNQDFDLIVNISEDGWFGKSIGPKQHFVHSIFRAIENGKYLIRSSNNGIAAVINPLGNVEKKVEFGKSGFIDFNENRKIQSTIFFRYGNKIFIIMILLYISMIFLMNKIKS